jgi:hypothetical protein
MGMRLVHELGAGSGEKERGARGAGKKRRGSGERGKREGGAGIVVRIPKID